MDFIIEFASQTWILLVAMAPYLLLGIAIAGILRVGLPKNLLYRHLSGNSIWSVIKASLFGVPLPLCSCGIIPVAAHLNKEGASKPAVLSFLTSTPTTGVDSILATYALMGPIVAIARPIIALLSGIVNGIALLIFDKNKQEYASPINSFSCTICEVTTVHTHSFKEKVKHAVDYSFVELIEDIGKWLILGIVLGGLISTLVPADSEFSQQFLANPWLSYSFMIVLGIPLYICSTGSIPVATGFLLSGVNPGAVLVFLIVGPATNTATLTFVGGKFGKKNLVIYLIALALTAIASGLVLDYFFSDQIRESALAMHEHGGSVDYLGIASAVVLVLLLIKAFVSKIMQNKKIEGSGKVYIIKDMNCNHCVKTVDSIIRKFDTVTDVKIDLKQAKVEIDGDFDEKELVSKLVDAGYPPERSE